MTDYRFRGEIPGSKSLFNRALIVKSYFPDLDLQGASSCDDVEHMRQGLVQLFSSRPIDCGEGGTTFRFLALRAARVPGEHILLGTARLMQRPQQGLLDLLRQLGCQAEIRGCELHIHSKGWLKPQGLLLVDVSESSQYASALVLNAWLLDFDLEFQFVGQKVSESYFQMTLSLLEGLGLHVDVHADGYRISAGQKISCSQYRVESDLSSAFTFAAAGALAGGACLENYPFHSTQPDGIFLEIFKRMHIRYQVRGSSLCVEETSEMQGVDWDLMQSPDLFPVLAVLCSWAKGDSKLFNAPHLTKKESNRIAKVADLLTAVGVSFEVLPDGMIIHGQPQQQLQLGLEFYPDQDHRMVMAAALMKLKGHGIKIKESHVISKSFPEFWAMTGLKA